MKHNKRQIISELKAIAAVMAMMFTVTSCGMMEDDQSNCPKELRVNFKYDMNMKFADAFPNEVKTVTLYAYDKDGKLALQKQESVKDIENRGGYMSVDELKPGKYTLKVWAEGEERFANSYVYGQPEPNINSLTSRINRSTRSIDHDITALYHGLLKDADLNLEGFGVKTATVDLTKNTNVVRVVMQNASGKKLNAADFDFYIKDDNSFLGYDNTAMSEDSITYVAWSKYDGILDNSHKEVIPDIDGSVTPTSAVVAEMTVNRLFETKNPQLCIFKHATGEKILQIPLIDYVLLVKGNYNKGMTDQEYLDRQDEYNFVFFIDDNHHWLAAQVYINSWRVVINNTEF